jgi:hypothetical protein
VAAAEEEEAVVAVVVHEVVVVVGGRWRCGTKWWWRCTKWRRVAERCAHAINVASIQSLESTPQRKCW